MKTITNSAQQTIALGEKIAQQSKPGDVLCLVGQLGTGKTQLVKGIARGLKIKANITSPTFVLAKTYHLRPACLGIKRLVHLDCYRLNSSAELLDLGWSEMITDRSNLVVVEWADKIKNLMPPGVKWIIFTAARRPNRRQIAGDF